jgi:hypothetical protein
MRPLRIETDSCKSVCRISRAVKALGFCKQNIQMKFDVAHEIGALCRGHCPPQHEPRPCIAASSAGSITSVSLGIDQHIGDLGSGKQLCTPLGYILAGKSMYPFGIRFDRF